MARYFKVWDVSKTIKRIVKANDIGELKSKDFFRIKHSRNLSTKTKPQAPPTVVETQDMATNTDDLPDDVDFEMELGDELTTSGGDNKVLSQAAKVGLGIGLGAIGTIVLTPVAVAAAGFGAAGIAGGSLAAAMMSSAAVANGGAVAAGSAVAVLQSIGAVGLGATGTAVVGGVGGAVGGVIGTAVAVLTRDKNRTRDTQTDSNITKWKATKNKNKER